jgi:hypothetical protein
MRDRLIDEMKKVFAADERRIKHAMKVLNYASLVFHRHKVSAEMGFFIDFRDNSGQSRLFI